MGGGLLLTTLIVLALSCGAAGMDSGRNRTPTGCTTCHGATVLTVGSRVPTWFSRGSSMPRVFPLWPKKGIACLLLCNP